MSKAQLIAEFGVFLAIGFFLLILFANLIGSEIVNINNKRESAAIEDIALMVKNEIDLSVQVLPGYKRSFTLPQDLDGIEYDIRIVQQSLIVSSGNKEIVYKIPKVDGAILKGTNVLENEHGTIKLN